MMEEKEFSFEGLSVYKSARQLVRDIYVLQHHFPKYEIYALGDQVRRSASSITSNIAEGSGRSSFKEKSHFVEIAYGSLMEAYSQLQIAQDLGYLSQEQLFGIKPQFIQVAKMLSGLKGYFDKKKSSNPNEQPLPSFSDSHPNTITYNQ
ncbi:MAG: four helix bundle protein [Bacteroidales bacterium]|nr:four helix bundle protein [Bacteroidales bacterium]